MRILPFLFGTVVLMSSCKPGRPSHVLSSGKMEKVLYDYHLAQGLAELGDSVDYRRYAYVQAVFQKHGITEAEFDCSMVWYCAHSYELQSIYQHLQERYEAEQAGINAAAVDPLLASSASGDTLSLWPGRRLYCLQRTYSSRQLGVVVEHPDTAQEVKSCTYMLRFDVRFVQDRNEVKRKLMAALVLRHENDSVRASLRTIQSDNRVEITVQSADTLRVEDVSAYFYLSDETPESAKVLVSQPVLVLMRKQKHDTSSLSPRRLP